LRKKRSLLIIVITIAAVSSLIFWNNSNSPITPQYNKTILRDTQTTEEAEVLKSAESLNYSNIISRERFIGSVERDAYLHPGTYLDYTSPNFIDSEVINYYSTRYDDLQGKTDPEHITLTYQANVTKRSDFRIFNSSPPEGSTCRNVTLVLSSSDGSFCTRNIGFMEFFYKNQTKYQVTDRNFDFNFYNCYVIEMNLIYNEVYAPTAGFFVTTEQILVLDRDWSPVLVGISTGMAVS
jgi:hypothetical protein